LSGLEYSLDDGAWLPYTSTLDLPDGIHDISFWAVDEAGLVSQINKTYQIDTRNPGIEGTLSGVSGKNGWFTSDVAVSASAFDPQPGSDIDTFTYALDGSAETSYTTPLQITDGQHSIQLDARDKAGLSYRVEQTVNVDTIAPTLNIQTTLPDWVKETTTLEGMATDTGSGLSGVEISTDGGQNWQPVTDPTSWNYRWDTSKDPNGSLEVMVRATDMAGLSATQTVRTGVDNKAPTISLPDSWLQWDTVTLDVQEEHSGLSEAHLEISDPQGRWPARIIALDGATFPMQFKWDRRFADGTTAPDGKYDVKVVAVDKLGNSSSKNALVTILLNLPPGPTATTIPTYQPSTTPTVSYTAAATATAKPVNTATSTQEGVVAKGFGSTPVPQFTATPKAAFTSTPRATPTQNSIVDWFDSILPSQLDATPSTTDISSLGVAAPATTDSGSNVLWGVTAATVMGALAANALEEKRKMEEERARQAAHEAEEEERREKKQDKHMEKMEEQRAQERAWEAAREAEQEQREAVYQTRMDARVEGREIQEEEKRIAEEKAELEQRIEKKKEEEAADKFRAAMAAYSAGREKATVDEGKEEAVSTEKDKSFWEKAWDWADQHQTEIALGVGIAVGVAATVITLGVASPLLAAAVVAGAAVSSAAGVALGTVALNIHYDREWDTNVLQNATLAGAAAAVVTGGAFLLQGAMTGAGAFCATHQSLCTHGEPILNAIDKAEELSLSAKLAYQTWRGDEEGAAQTALDIQMEQFDGGMPGNSVAKEIKEDVADVIENHADETAEILEAYGDDGLRLIELYKDDVYDFVKQAEKQGRNPLEVLYNPPEPGQTLEGWLLNITAPNSPVNMKSNLKLSDAKIDDLLDQSLENIESNEFVLGYFDPNQVDGYIELADQRKAIKLSMPESLYEQVGFQDGTGDFWQVNRAAIQYGVDERKTFVLSTDFDTIMSNPEKYTYAEVQMILQPGNGYVRVKKDGYDMLIPSELLVP
jgi:hypothetical protein